MDAKGDAQDEDEAIDEDDLIDVLANCQDVPRALSRKRMLAASALRSFPEQRGKKGKAQTAPPVYFHMAKAKVEGSPSARERASRCKS